MKPINSPHKRMFVGKEVSVLGARGIIVKETKRMLAVRTAAGTKWYPKTGNTFVIAGERIAGEEMLGRHEDRLKV